MNRRRVRQPFAAYRYYGQHGEDDDNYIVEQQMNDSEWLDWSEAVAYDLFDPAGGYAKIAERSIIP